MPFKNPILALLPLFFPLLAKSKGEHGHTEAGFQQTRCGTALVNKHWDEEDQWHCSPFNTAPEEQENTRYSVPRLPPHALAHETTIYL